MKSIVLVGFMGAGKSAVGRELAELLGMNFADLDEELEAWAGISIMEIFKQHGETYFRELEKKILTKLLNIESVLAVGGGTFIDINNIKLINDRALSVWLNVSLGVCAFRADKDGDTRPLFQDKEKAASLYSERQQFYHQAAIHIDADQKSPTEVAKRIISIMRSQEE